MSVPVHILGISAYYHDAAAALLRDGRILAATQEERFSRKKHDPRFPSAAIDYCLDETDDNCTLGPDEDLPDAGAFLLYTTPYGGVETTAPSTIDANQLLAFSLFVREAGDTVLGLSLDHGGHLTHGSPVNISGRFYRFVPYQLTQSDERIDMDRLRDTALAERPKMIIAGATAYPRAIDAARAFPRSRAHSSASRAGSSSGSSAAASPGTSSSAASAGSSAASSSTGSCPAGSSGGAGGVGRVPGDGTSPPSPR